MGSWLFKFFYSFTIIKIYISEHIKTSQIFSIERFIYKSMFSPWGFLPLEKKYFEVNNQLRLSDTNNSRVFWCRYTLWILYIIHTKIYVKMIQYQNLSGNVLQNPISEKLYNIGNLQPNIEYQKLQTVLVGCMWWAVLGGKYLVCSRHKMHKEFL